MSEATGARNRDFWRSYRRAWAEFAPDWWRARHPRFHGADVSGDNNWCRVPLGRAPLRQALVYLTVYRELDRLHSDGPGPGEMGVVLKATEHAHHTIEAYATRHGGDLAAEVSNATQHRLRLHNAKPTGKNNPGVVCVTARWDRDAASGCEWLVAATGAMVQVFGPKVDEMCAAASTLTR